MPATFGTTLPSVKPKRCSAPPLCPMQKASPFGEALADHKDPSLRAKR